MITRAAALLILALLAALFSGGVNARKFGLGHLGLGMGKLGAAGSQGSNGTPAGCTMNGVFDLTKTCNDIYFIGALK